MNELIKQGLGLESIDFQTDDFFDKIEEWVRKARQDYGLMNATTKSEQKRDNITAALSKIIKDRTNMNIEAHTWFSPIGIDAWTVFSVVPAHNINSARMTGEDRSIHSTKEFMNLYEELSKRSPGYLDRKKAKVYGFFSEVKFDLVLGINFLKNPELTTHEIAGIILHEIAHCWDMLEKMSVTYSITQGMSELHRSLTGVTDPADRKYMLDYLSKKELNLLKDHDLDTVSKAAPSTIVTLIIADRVCRLKSQTGVTGAELKSSEDAADVFAARFGAAKHLASATSKVGKEFIDMRSRSKAQHYFIQVITATFYGVLYKLGSFSYLAGLPAAVALTTLLGINLIFRDPFDSGSRHADTGKRMINMRNQLIIRLKDRDLPKQVRDSVVSEIKMVDTLIADINDNHDILDVFVRVANPMKTSKLRKQELMYHLERMANNKLFAASAKIQSLA